MKNSNVIYGKLDLPNGGRYEGEIIDGEPNGKGVVKFDDGETHEGMFKDGVPNGKGKNSWANGMYIEADFKDGEPVGAGKCKVIYSGGDMPEGSYYEGECLDLQPHGWGRKVMPGWSDREGEWRNGEPHGYSVNKVSDAFAAKAGAQSGWTGEGVVIQGAQRNWWIRTGNGKTEMLRAGDNNFDIPQEDLPLSLKARLFLGFVEMYLSERDELMEYMLKQPIEEKSELYYIWLLAGMQAAEESEENYAALAKMAKYFSNISDYKDCAALAEKCNRKGGHYAY
jgi:hypothetical protein